MNKIIVDLERVELSQTILWQSMKAVMELPMLCTAYITGPSKKLGGEP